MWASPLPFVPITATLILLAGLFFESADNFKPVRLSPAPVIAVFLIKLRLCISILGFNVSKRLATNFTNLHELLLYISISYIFSPGQLMTK